MNLKGSTFLVTGGASGLGEACVRRFAAQEANIIILDRNEDLGSKLAEEVGSNCKFIATDVSDEASVATAIKFAVEKFGGIQGAINCAGIGGPEKTVGKDGPHSLNNFQKIVTVNLVGSFNVCRLAAAQMSQQEPNKAGERGILISTASVAAFEGQVGQVAYSASKGGIVAMTLPMARDLSRSGIRVLCIAPGTFDTPMVAGLSDKVRDSLGEMVPFPSRLGKPDEYASLAQHMVENEMLNGEVVRLDGAIRMSPR